MIQDKEISRDLFYKEVLNSIQAFLIKHPSKILHPQQRQRLLKGLSRYLEDDHECLQYIEVDYHDRESKNPYGSLQKIEDEALLLPMSLEESNNQTLEVTDKMNLVQLSEHHYEDQMMQSRLDSRIEVIKQSESDISQPISKSIQEIKKEVEKKRLTRSEYQKINGNSKYIENIFEGSPNNKIKVQEKQIQYLQTIVTSQPKRLYRSDSLSQDSRDESETYLYYQQKYKCVKRANRINYPRKTSNKIAKNVLKQAKKQTKQDPSKKYGTKGRKPEFPDMENKLIAWIEKMCKNNIRITQAIIRNRAMTLVKQIPNQMNRFRASKGWMQKFFKRHIEIFEMLSRRNKLNPIEYIEDEACEKIEDKNSLGQEIYEE